MSSTIRPCDVSDAAPVGAAPLTLKIDHAGPDGTRILGPLSLSIAAGETVALTGPSGVGKTTLARIAAGLDQSFEGSRSLSGRTAVVFQEPVLLPWRTAADNLAICCGLDRAGALRALESVDLAGQADQRPNQMSLGQQRRLSLARAFALRPEVLIMDEPFVSLDPATAGAMHALFEALRADCPAATLLVTHDMAEARRLADRILRMEGAPGRIVAD